MIDISILRVLSTRDGFDKMYSAIPLKALEPLTRNLVQDIQRYYTTYTDDAKIDFVLFRDSFKRWHPSLDADKLKYYDTILKHAEENLEDVSRTVLINSMLELQLATDAQQLLQDYNDGEEVSLIHDLADLAEMAMASTERKSEDNWIKPDMNAIIESLDVKNGLQWRLPSMNKALRPLQGGDAVLVAGRPDTGKTTFITDNITYMATQLDERPIIWLNNEGPGQRIVSRMIQSALGISTPEMMELHAQGVLTQQYGDIIGGLDKIRVIDIHDYWNWQVAELIELHRPKLVVMDMIDNIKFSGMSLSQGARTDQILESMYSWARIQAVKYDCVMMSTSQISADGEGMQYPSMDMLKDSKTGKQGTLDLQIMIGKGELEDFRYIGTPKNKLRMPGEPGYFKHEVMFNNEQARYLEPTVTAGSVYDIPTP